MLRWYLLHTKPLGETTARTNLERQGYEVYFPRVLHTVRRRQRRQEQIAPLFPRYLFLRLCDGQQSLKPVHSTLGVSSVVRFGVQYGNVSDEVVALLKANEDSATGFHRLRPSPMFEPGARVRVTAGPLEGFEGLFECEAGPQRALLLLKLLGHEARVQISCDFIDDSCAA